MVVLTIFCEDLRTTCPIIIEKLCAIVLVADVYKPTHPYRDSSDAVNNQWGVIKMKMINKTSSRQSLGKCCSN